jgi:signal transduction histidine kinase
LAISKGIVERHGGRIWLESSGKPGEGSVFHVELPLRASPPPT